MKKVNKRLTALIDRTKQHISEDLVKHAEDIGAWLRAKVPALRGPYQSTPFVKYVLRKLVYVSSANILQDKSYLLTVDTDRPSPAGALDQ